MQILRDANQLGPGLVQATQGVDANGIGGEQIAEIDSDWSGGRRADAAEIVHLRRVQPPGQQHGAPALVVLHHLNPTFHADA
jgi:hypothetical protein